MKTALTLDIHADDAPLYVRIARALSREIRRGRLPPGSQLPGSRSLAASLQVHRNTVLSALRELEAEGWIVSHPAHGTFVSEVIPVVRPRGLGRSRRQMAETVELVLPEEHEFERHVPLPTGIFTLFGGIADLRLVPHQLIARSYRSVLRRRPTLLGYGDERGEPELRRQLADSYRRTRGVVGQDDSWLVTRGAQMAIYLSARALAGDGRTILVESYGYRPAWHAMTLAGARVVPIPVDDEGLQISAVERRLAHEPIAAVYVTPHHQYPTTVTLSVARRLQLLELAQRHRFAILEDDYDHEFHYEGRPVLPMASADPAGVVIYIGTLSKMLAPALRVGFVHAPAKVIDRMARLRYTIDRQGDRVLEAALAELVADGTLERQARKIRRLYRARRDAMTEALERHFGQRLVFEVPNGGMAIWAEARGHTDVDAWLKRCTDRGVAFQTARRFDYENRSRPFVRLGFAAHDEKEIATAVSIMAKAW